MTWATGSCAYADGRRSTTLRSAPVVHDGRKNCPKCGEDKRPEEFYVNRASRDGRTSRCKGCAKAYASAYRRRADPERRRDHMRAWRQRNPDRVLAYKPSPSRRERRKDYDRAYYERNRHRHGAIVRDYYQRHRDERMAYGRQYYRDNRERQLAIQRAYRTEHAAANPIASTVRAREEHRRRQDATLTMAVLHRKPWSPGEDSLVLGSQLPLLEIALVLGRTYNAVRERRKTLRRAAQR